MRVLGNFIGDVGGIHLPQAARAVQRPHARRRVAHIFAFRQTLFIHISLPSFGCCRQAGGPSRIDRPS